MTVRADLSAGALAALLLVVPASAADAPEPGFLEFLGMLVEEDGEYLDPLDLADTELAGTPGPADEQGDGPSDVAGASKAEAAEKDHESDH